jgi:hypothetical protein
MGGKGEKVIKPVDENTEWVEISRVKLPLKPWAFCWYTPEFRSNLVVP